MSAPGEQRRLIRHYADAESAEVREATEDVSAYSR